MRKIAALLAALTLIFALAACGQAPSPEQTVAPTESQEATQPATEAGVDPVSAVARFVELEHYDEPVVEGTYTKYAWKGYKDFSGIPRSGRIVVAGTPVRGGQTKASQLLEQGWAFMDQSIEGVTIAKGVVSSYEMEKDGCRMLVSFFEEKHDSVSLMDAKVGYVTLPQYAAADGYSERAENATDFEIDGAITQASTMRDVVDFYGEPGYITVAAQGQRSYIVFQYGALEIQFSANGRYICEVICY